MDILGSSKPDPHTLFGLKKIKAEAPSVIMI
jgi:hypothetical protein